MKNLVRTVITVSLLSFGLNVWAGMPVEEEISCPLGGEAFTITGTASCTTMGRTLSLKPVTSCDFVTRLPICPKNGLPIYKEFSDQDISKLGPILKNAKAEAGDKTSPYYLAYLVEKELAPEDVETQFYTLQQGLWYDAARTSSDLYSETYDDIADKALEKFEGVEKNFWQGAKAFRYFTDGNRASARAALKEARENQGKDQEYLEAYLSALDACISKKAKKNICTSETPIRAHDSDEK